MSELATLDETSKSLAGALHNALSRHFGTDVWVGPINTGGGCMVLCADLSQDGRGVGRQLWLTREDDWYLGFYDFSGDDMDPDYDEEGVVVSLPLSQHDADTPAVVASVVARILRNLGVTLQSS